MADKIAVMSNGIIEQYGTPAEVYNRPASMFVADFIGSPPMNFIRFEAGLKKGDTSVTIGGQPVFLPEIREDIAPTKLALGIRPEHIRFDDRSGLRGQVFETAYLGTSQIVAVDIGGTMIKARTSSSRELLAGDNVGLTFDGPKLSLFEEASGRAIRTALHDGGHHG